MANPTKLTLRLDKAVIDRGKTYARRNGTSLSKLFEKYIMEMTDPSYEPVKVIDIHPDVLALMGSPNDRSFTSNREIYDDYYKNRRAHYLDNSEEE